MITKKFKVRIITKTGLHIWSGNDSIEIGGMDNPVIKTMDSYPYIPASSLKGKLRGLYEVSLGWEVLSKNWWLREFDWKNYDEVSMFFGKAGNKKENLDNLGPTRFLFRDLFLKQELDEDDKINWWLYSLKELREMRESGQTIFEEKTEITINRHSWTAKHWWLRQMERVPAGTVFEWSLIVRFFEKPDKETEEKNFKLFGENNLSFLKELVEGDYLWGSGSRWSGVIQIDFILVE